MRVAKVLAKSMKGGNGRQQEGFLAMVLSYCNSPSVSLFSVPAVKKALAAELA